MAPLATAALLVAIATAAAGVERPDEGDALLGPVLREVGTGVEGIAAPTSGVRVQVPHDDGYDDDYWGAGGYHDDEGGYDDGDYQDEYEDPEDPCDNWDGCPGCCPW